MKRSMLVGLGVAASAATAVAARLATRPLPEVAVPGRTIELDGERIHYLDQGEGQAVLLIHGFAASSFTWRHVFPELQATHRTVAIDLPGFGYSDRAAGLDYSLEAQARRAARLLDTLGIARATVVGHSMGGAVAQRLALAHPERVERLVLLSSVDASEPAPWHDGHRLNFALLPVFDLGLRFPPLVRFASRQIVKDIVVDGSYVTPDVVDGYIRPMLVRGTARAVAALVRQSRDDPVADLGRISVPTLVLSGEQDPAVPASVGEGIAGKIPGGRHVVIPATGHLAAEERPEAFLQAVRSFLNEPMGGEASAASG